MTLGKSDGDSRSYKVSFEKIKRCLPGFSAKRSATLGAEQLREIFERIDMPQETFQYRAFTRLKQLEYLIRTQQIDSQFFWRQA
jgi:hypothetical protein